MEETTQVTQTQVSGYLPAVYGSSSSSEGVSNPKLDIILSLLSKSHSLSELRTHLSDYDLSEEINAFLDILDKSKGSALNGLRLPAEIVSDSKSLNPKNLLRYLKTLLNSRNFDRSKSESVSASKLSTTLVGVLVGELAGHEFVAQLKQELYFSRLFSHQKDPTADTTSFDVWIKANAEQITNTIQTALQENYFHKKAANVHSLLQGRSTRQFTGDQLTDGDTEEHPQLSNLVDLYTAYFSTNPTDTSALIDRSLTHRRTGVSAVFERADIANQVSLGLWDLRLNSRVSVQQLNVKMIVETKPGLQIRSGVVEAFPVIARTVGHQKDDKPIQLPTCDELISKLLPHTFDRDHYADSDFDRVAVYIERSALDFRLIPTNTALDSSSIDLFRNNLYLLLNHERGFANYCSTGAVFVGSHNTHLDISDQYLAIFPNRDGKATLQDLESFARARIKQEHGVSYQFIVRTDLNTGSLTNQGLVSAWTSKDLPLSTLVADLPKHFSSRTPGSLPVCFFIPSTVKGEVEVSEDYATSLAAPPASLSLLLTIPSLLKHTLESSRSLAEHYGVSQDQLGDKHFIPSDLLVQIEGFESCLEIPQRLSAKDFLGTKGQNHEYIIGGAAVNLSAFNTVLQAVWIEDINSDDQPENQLGVIVPASLASRLSNQGVRISTQESPFGADTQLIPLSELTGYGASVRLLHYNKEIRLLDD